MTAQSLLQALPLFPLSTVLFPGAVLPLRIFELRYLEMIGRAHRDGTPFGVVALTAGREVQQPGASESFEAVGTLASIELLDKPQPGLLAIRCRATRRFRLDRHERRANGLWVGDATLLPDDAALALPPDLQPLATTLRALLEQLALAGAPAPPPPHRFDDCGWVANRWCELLPLAPAVKQRLLETDSPLLRLELAADLLESLQQRGGGADVGGS